MANIFLQLSEFQFKRETLENITGASSNPKVNKVIETFYKSDKNSLVDYGNILIDLISLCTSK